MQTSLNTVYLLNRLLKSLAKNQTKPKQKPLIYKKYPQPQNQWGYGCAIMQKKQCNRGKSKSHHHQECQPHSIGLYILTFKLGDQLAGHPQ